jgi:hypothetical protein
MERPGVVLLNFQNSIGDPNMTKGPRGSLEGALCDRALTATPIGLARSSLCANGHGGTAIALGYTHASFSLAISSRFSTISMR